VAGTREGTGMALMPALAQFIEPTEEFYAAFAMDIANHNRKAR